jgi:hypothetical protein
MQFEMICTEILCLETRNIRLRTPEGQEQEFYEYRMNWDMESRRHLEPHAHVHLHSGRRNIFLPYDSRFY